MAHVTDLGRRFALSGASDGCLRVILISVCKAYFYLKQGIQMEIGCEQNSEIADKPYIVNISKCVYNSSNTVLKFFVSISRLYINVFIINPIITE